MSFLRYSILSLLVSCWTVGLLADDPTETRLVKPTDNAANGSQGEAKAAADKFTFQLSEEVRSALMPLLESIRSAKVSRVTVEMLADSVLSGQVVDSRESTLQIASRLPGSFTVYLKEPDQRTRLYCDGGAIVAAMAPDAYFTLPEQLSIQEAITDLPVPMGPYPEPLLALSFAGCDPAVSLIGGMKSIELVDKDKFRGEIPAVHLHGVQADDVTWDLWISAGDEPQPLRMLIDLTPMLIASKDVHVPAGYSSQVRYDFLTWRMTGKVEDSLFVFKKAPNAVEYESLEDYFQKITGTKGYHPLLGKPAPAFVAKTFGKKGFDSKLLKGRVVVLDFWSTWCEPCLTALPIIKKVADRYSDKGVVFLAVNTGEETEEVREFLRKERLSMNVLLDENGKIADGYLVESIPQTVVIGKDGLVESVHLGFADEESLEQRLTDELDVMVVGGRIGSAEAGASQQGKNQQDGREKETSDTQVDRDAGTKKVPRKRP
ncbi:redoxin domain-containing protein [Rubripirellula amarantea]|nr:redoxin domain-containing protein [Rubripirellula amarantea]